MIINGMLLMEAAPILDMIPSKERIHGLSYGLSEVGYDFRIKQKVIFHAPQVEKFMYLASYGHLQNHTFIELQRLLEGYVEVEQEDGSFKSFNGRTAIGSSIECFNIPSNLWCEFRNKSTHARRFLDASLGTDGEPGWKGHLTIEMVFQGSEDYTLPAGCPILKAVFHEISEHRSYRGKYQNQADKPVDAIFE